MCMPPLATKTDSPGETLEVPQDPCQHWRGILRFQHRLHTRSYAGVQPRWIQGIRRVDGVGVERLVYLLMQD